jgi:hypothetical protein
MFFRFKDLAGKLNSKDLYKTSGDAGFSSPDSSGNPYGPVFGL